MPISKMLENSAMDFSIKYGCNFDFASFESSIEEFTFLRPVNGWIDTYKTTFEKLYKSSLEKAAVGKAESLDGEAMLDDFEYTLIRPYVKENGTDIKHKPYIGMDRITRIEYLERLTREVPSNHVDLITQKYKSGELSIGQMRSQASFALKSEKARKEKCVEVASYVQALENVNKSRSFIWRTFHPLKNKAEKNESLLMKKMLIDKADGAESFYDEVAAAAYETFDGYKKANERLAQNKVHASEEMSRTQKMNDVIRESLRIEGLDTEHMRSPFQSYYKASVREKQI